MPTLTKHWGLLLILLIYLSLAITHSLVVPLTTGNDEWAHFLYTRFIAEHGRLPATWAEREAAGYKADAPPLYHLLVAATTAGVEPTRLLRPLDSPRRELADNQPQPYALVHTAVEQMPYRGEVLLWHLGRGLSILFGLSLIVVTYLTGLALSSQPRQALLAAAFVAFLPAVIFHSSVLSYESFSASLTALFLWVGIKAIQQPTCWRWWLGLGLLTGLAITTKYSAVLLPLEVIFIIYLASRSQSRIDTTNLVRRGTLVALAAMLTLGWWFGFVAWHFNTVESQGPMVGLIQPLLVGDASDTTSIKVAGFLFGENAVQAESRPPLPRNYLRLAQSFIESFWAAPVVGEFVLAPWLPLLFTLMAGLGLLGLISVWRRDPARRGWLVLLLVHSLLITPLLLIRVAFSFDPQEVAQGRHVLLPAASAIAILLSWGWERWSPRLGPLVIIALLGWSALGQVGWAARSYPPPLPIWPAAVAPEPPASASSINTTLAEAMRLTAVTWHVTESALEVTVWWQALALLPQDFLVELTLRDQADQVVGYSLGHPVQGRYPTRAWEPGDVIKDNYRVPLVAHPAGVYSLQLRLLDRAAQPLDPEQAVSLGPVALTGASGELDPCRVWGTPSPAGAYPVRSSLILLGPVAPMLLPPTDRPSQIPLRSVAGFHVFVVEPNWADSYQLVAGAEPCQTILSFDIPPRSFIVPEISNPLAANFNDEIKLLGYDLPTRRIAPGGRLPLTLYWQALATTGQDYRIFDNLLDSEQRRWGGYDRRTRDGYSTLLWVPGEVITDPFGVPVNPAAPSGIYWLDIGLYDPTADGPVSLPLVERGQPLAQSSVRIGPVKVGGPPPSVIVTDPSPQIRLDQPFGNQLTLLGYDLTDQNNQPIQNPKSPIQNLKLTLYWRVEQPLDRDYTTFLHLRDAANQNAAQKDAPPANGQYPTSLWDAGEIIKDDLTLPLAEVRPGRYVPTIGLYDFASGDRLPVSSHPANELPLTAVEIR